MSRLSNLIIFTILSSSIYVTFSVKNDVAILAKKVVVLKHNIQQEKDRIDVYKAEWAALTGAEHIDKLQKTLMPQLKVVSVNQIKTIDSFNISTQIAQNDINNLQFQFSKMTSH